MYKLKTPNKIGFSKALVGWWEFCKDGSKMTQIFHQSIHLRLLIQFTIHKILAVVKPTSIYFDSSTFSTTKHLKKLYATNFDRRLHLHAYKLQLTQHLRPTDHAQHQTFPNWILEHQQVDYDYSEKIIFNDEMHF